MNDVEAHNENLAPSSGGNDSKRAGLEPEEFQRRLVFVTAVVLVLGLVGGTCLGLKIRKAENAQAAQPEQIQPTTPDERARESTASSHRE